MSTGDIIGAIIAYTIVSCIIYIIIYVNVAQIDDEPLFYYGPVTKCLYEVTTMNIVGCVLVSLVLYIVVPVLIPVNIVKLIYFLFHVGRRKK